MDRVQRWSRGTWTTAEIRNSVERVRGFFHDTISIPPVLTIGSPLIGEAKVLFGKADFFLSPGRLFSVSCSPSVTALANRWAVVTS